MRVPGSALQRKLALCCCWFFLVLLSYYCLKPLRDGLGSSLAGRLGDVYLVTFISTVVGLSIYSKLVAILGRRSLVMVVYQFFAICLIGFGFLLRSAIGANLLVVAAFFVWVSVFNIFVVTLFWSVMADVFDARQGKAWFGAIAAAGSIGSVVGSGLAYQVSRWFGSTGLVAASLISLQLAVIVAMILLSNRWLVPFTAPSMDDGQQDGDGSGDEESEQGTGGTIWAGFTHVLKSPYLLAICAFVAAGKFAATFVYNNLQVMLDVQMPDEAQRTTLFSHMNIYAQAGSLVTQAVIVGWIMKRMGVTAALLIPCLLTIMSFGWLMARPVLGTLIVMQVAQQILAYGMLVPAQHVLFTVVSREDKYKSKGFTDMVVFRGSDVAAGKACDWLLRTGAGLAMLSAAMLPVVAAWGLVAGWLGWSYQRRVAQPHEAVKQAA